MGRVYSGLVGARQLWPHDVDNPEAAYRNRRHGVRTP